MVLGALLLAGGLCGAVPLAASRSECRHPMKVSTFTPPKETPVVSKHWQLLPPGEACTYRWKDGATLTYNKTVPWVRSHTVQAVLP